MAILVNGVKVAGVGVPGTNGKDATINGVNALTVEGLDPIVAQMVGSALQISLSGDIGGAKVETGTYTGNGQFGYGNKNSLVFGFTPKFVLIGSTDSMTPSYGDRAIYSWGSATFGPDTANGNCSVQTSGNTMSWYGVGDSTNAAAQFNLYGIVYQYMALA